MSLYLELEKMKTHPEIGRNILSMAGEFHYLPAGWQWGIVIFDT